MRSRRNILRVRNERPARAPVPTGAGQASGRADWRRGQPCSLAGCLVFVLVAALAPPRWGLVAIAASWLLLGFVVVKLPWSSRLEVRWLLPLTLLGTFIGGAGAVADAIRGRLADCSVLTTACALGCLFVSSCLRLRSGRRWNSAASTLLDGLLVATSFIVLIHLLTPDMPWRVDRTLLLWLSTAAAVGALLAPIRGLAPVRLATIQLGVALWLLGQVTAGRHFLVTESGSWAILWTCVSLAVLIRALSQGHLTSPAPEARPTGPGIRRRFRIIEIVPVVAVILGVLILVDSERGPRFPVLAGLIIIPILLLFREALLHSRMIGWSRSLRRQSRERAFFDQLADLDEFGRLVAHELRNSLSVLYSSIGLLERDRPRQQRLEILQTLSEEGEHVRALASQLTAFRRSNQDDQRREAFLSDIGVAAARNATGKTTWPRDVTLDIEWLTEGDLIRADDLLLEYALTNLLVSCAQGGASQVTVREELTIDSTSPSARLEIRGDGTTVDEALFSGGPSKLVASRGEGAALGLAVARRAIKEHGGELTLERGDPQGLCIIVSLPLVPPGDLD
ncbi:MAG: HAMP domain-containing sensor histidine kinase [Acidobacteriota bacterium]